MQVVLTGVVAGAFELRGRDFAMRSRTLVALSLLAMAFGSLNDDLEAAEDASYMEVHSDGTVSRMVDRMADADQLRALDRMARGDDEEEEEYWASRWASNMREIRLGANEVEDEVLPEIKVAADEATLMKAPGQKGLAVFMRKQLAGMLQVDVLENQLVVVSGMESKEDKKRRASMGLDLDDVENVFASELACRSINGTAFFMLVGRRAIEGSPHAHEIAFFDSELWNVFVEYMRAARRGGGQQRVQRIHWNVMAIEQRIPWVLEEPDATLRVVARPRIRA